MKKGILLLAFLLAICCGSGLYAQNVSCKSYFEVVETNDENHRLNEVAIYPPVFGTLPEGKRLKIKVCNNDEKKLKKAFFYVYGVTCTFHPNISPCVNLKNDGFSDFTGTLLSFIKK